MTDLNCGAQNKQSRKIKIFYIFLRISLVISVLGLIWIPEFLHFHIDRSMVSPETVAAATKFPETKILNEVADLRFAASTITSDTNLSEIAEAILQGWLNAPSFIKQPLQLRGYPADLRVGTPTFQLAMASMDVENILLSAFEENHDERFLGLAIARSLALATYESAQVRDNGFLWNDHAIASRISVLTKLWLHMRVRSNNSTESSRIILSFISRSGRLLAKNQLFTVRTNHGVMQNLALLQIGAAFPTLPEAENWRQLAIERLKVQIPFYVSKEGFVLEHSPEYHLFGTELLRMAIRLSLLNGLQPDHGLIEATMKAQVVLADIIRPNGTLPAIGNTSLGISHKFPTIDISPYLPSFKFPPYPSPSRNSRIYPLSGYATWSSIDSNNIPAKTLIAWAKHDGHGHKHSDEASLVFWSGDIDWITNTGYWPYGHPLTEKAYSWNASNAPHEVGEATHSLRQTRLLSSGQLNDTKFIELERTNNSGATFRREILQINANTLVILDFSKNSAAGTETIWTVGPTLHLAASQSDRIFKSNTVAGNRSMSASFALDPAATVSTYHGSEKPFAGWIVVNGKPTPTDAIRVFQPVPTSNTAVAFHVGEAQETTAWKVVLEPESTPEQWTIRLVNENGTILANRNATKLEVTGNIESGQLQNIQLIAPEDNAKDAAALKDAYAYAISLYPPWYNLTEYRKKLSYLIIALGLSIEFCVLIISRRQQPITIRQYLIGHCAIAIFWLSISIWAIYFYLQK